MTYFKKLIEEKDKTITLSHQKKDIDVLEKVLIDLNNECTELKENFNNVTYLLDLIEKHQINVVNEKTKNIIAGETEHLSIWLKNLKDIFEGLYKTPSKELSIDEIDFIKLEIPKLNDKKEKLNQQIRYLNNIIAKTSILLMDLRDESCKEISKGDNIVAVTQKMVTKFGDKIVGTYIFGRKEIIKFLEKTFKINRINSKELIDLLEKCHAINFKIDIPENDVFYYYKDYGFADEFVPIIGAWNINY